MYFKYSGLCMSLLLLLLPFCILLQDNCYSNYMWPYSNDTPLLIVGQCYKLILTSHDYVPHTASVVRVSYAILCGILRNPKHHIQVSRLFNCNVYVLLTHLTMILIQLRGVFIQPLVWVEIQQGFREGSQWIIASYITTRHQMVQGFLSCVHETVIEP